MRTICLNCKTSYEGKYCPECGQKATTGRLTFTTLLGDIIHFFTHLESGFAFTTWKYVARPGQTSKAFIAGERKKHQKPVSYFLIWTGLYILVHNLVIRYGHYQLSSEVVTMMEVTEESNIFFRQHFNVLIVPVLFISAFILYVVLGRPKYNFIEVLTASLYGAGTYFMLSLLTDVILGIFFSINILRQQVFYWQAALSMGYNFWFSYDFFRQTGLRFLWPRLILASMLVAAVGWAIMFYLPVWWMYLTGT